MLIPPFSVTYGIYFLAVSCYNACALQQVPMEIYLLCACAYLFIAIPTVWLAHAHRISTCTGC